MWRKRKPVVDEKDRVIGDPERARERTMSRAVRLLAARPRSVGELKERLLEKNWTNLEIVDAVIEKLSEYKYLDDKQFAADVAVSKLRRQPQGRRRLKQTLSQKKLDKETVDQAIESAFDKLPEADLIDQAISKQLRLKGKPETREGVKKLYDYLLRRGFSYDLIISKIRHISELDADEPVGPPD